MCILFRAMKVYSERAEVEGGEEAVREEGEHV